jgi:MinD-like ATPase involved in chromosome partitioning or flagellar assembly
MGVLIANPKGGVGKTPSALILGGVFANVRGGQSVVYEVTDDAGSLAVRAEGPMTVGVAELARDAGEIRGAGQLASYTTQQTSYAAVIGAPRDRSPLGYEDVQRVSDLLGFFYPVRVMDSGNQLSSGAMYGALARADALVIPVLEAIDSVRSAAQLTRYLRRLGSAAAQLAEGAIVLRIDDGRPASAEVRSYVDDALASAGLCDVHRIPYDPHIAERSTITLGKLRPATVEAYTYAAAAVTHRLNSLVN